MDIPRSREKPKIWRLRSGYLENWSDWKKYDIVSVGWDIGPIRGDVTEENAITDNYNELSEAGSEVKERVTEKFFDDAEDNDPSNAYGTVRTVTATRRDRYFAPGDYVVVFGHKIRGQPVIHGVAQLKEYVGSKFDIEKESHPYQWSANYIAKGPIRKHDLSEKFDGGEMDLFLRPTLWEFHDASADDIMELAEEINDLRESGKDISLSQSYFDYKESDMQRYIGDHISKIRDDISHVTAEYWIDETNRADFYCELENSDILLIETKQKHATNDDLNQLLDYIDTYENEEGEKSEGLLIAPGFPEDTINKAQRNNINLQKFSPEAEFKMVE